MKMNFLVVLFVAIALFVSANAQTTESMTSIISDISDSISSDYSPTSDYYSSDYSTYPSSYDYYYSDYYDEVTTTKPFKQQFLSLLFNKKAG
ncbi:uncharacterized protein LOC135432359 [Drosophila montana]|uniref:uncharacterized protein LOC135432359 n=1 Tax=Drosophila montana TaxID=40370 RepID=UPI00313C7779